MHFSENIKFCNLFCEDGAYFLYWHFAQMNLKIFLVSYNETQYSLPLLLMWGIKFYTHTECNASNNSHSERRFSLFPWLPSTGLVAHKVQEMFQVRDSRKHTHVSFKDWILDPPILSSIAFTFQCLYRLLVICGNWLPQFMLLNFIFVRLSLMQLIVESQSSDPPGWVHNNFWLNICCCCCYCCRRRRRC